MNSLKVTYRIAAEHPDPTGLAASLLSEQTVEVPREVAERDPFVREHMMGSIRELSPQPDGSVLATLSLPVHTASSDAAQLLNVLFGNASLQSHVSLHGFELPEALRTQYEGPRYGILGLRERCDVTDRPLTLSALKPVGLHVEKLASLCRTLAEGGIDIIKDDHYLADQPQSRFKERVRTCLDVVRDVSACTGHTALYVPHLSGTPTQMKRRAETAQHLGARAVLVAPALVGLPAFEELVRCELDVPVLAHPSLAGTWRLPPPLLQGRLFRLFGADGVIFAGHGGRFGTCETESGRLLRALREPWMGLRPSLPIVAGGMQVERTSELVEFYGLDAGLLVGGSLLASENLPERVAAFVNEVQRAALTWNA